MYIMYVLNPKRALIELIETDRTRKKHFNKYINNRKKENLVFPLITFIMKEIPAQFKNIAFRNRIN